MKDKIAALRKEYSLKSLDVHDVAAHPVEEFERWFEEALHAEVEEPNAMFLATASAGRVSGRVVLLKGIEEGSFVFFTNYNSLKAQSIAENPYVALTFLWIPLERQVRIEGLVSRVSEEYATQYFHSRPRESQIGAWVSPQSQVIENRDFLEEEYQRYQARFAEEALIPKPPHWGGFAVKPQRMEFWQGRASRLHDRILYEQAEGSNIWTIQRLAP
jgi:pyridoxamine 5'-phosphate oxidase